MAAHKLKPLAVDKLKKAGLHGDGAGLWLKVTEAGSKSWILRYTSGGRERWMGLGPYPDVSVAEAREKAAELRKQVRAGIDPLDEKHEQRAISRAATARSVTFDWCAEQFIDAHKAGWRNPKHVDQWRNTIATYASPIIGKLSVDKVDTAHIMRIMEKDALWTQKNETASRLRGRLENVMDWATVRKYRAGDNPARWKGHLDKLLPAKSKVQKNEHHAALPWPEIGTFMEAMRKVEGMGALALEFAILTAARSGEVRGATWTEIDIDSGMWIVPAERMKAKREHRVPLSKQALAVLTKAGTKEGLIFPGMKKETALSDMSLSAVLKRMARSDLTVHGFRSTFRDWCAESTNYPRDMAEMALAHTVGDKVEAAYRRGDMLDKRRHMMQAWADFCDKKITGEVIPMRSNTA